jgi:hypothetical protein
VSLVLLVIPISFCDATHISWKWNVENLQVSVFLIIVVVILLALLFASFFVASRYYLDSAVCFTLTSCSSMVAPWACYHWILLWGLLQADSSKSLLLCQSVALCPVYKHFLWLFVWFLLQHLLLQLFRFSHSRMIFSFSFCHSKNKSWARQKTIWRKQCQTILHCGITANYSILGRCDNKMSSKKTLVDLIFPNTESPN